MFDNTVLFEYRFWEIYEKEVPQYKGSRREFTRMAREIAKLGERRAPRRREYSMDERRRIMRAYNGQDESMKKKVRDYLEKNCKNVMDGGEIRVK